FIWPVFLVIVGIIVIFSRRIDIPRYAEIGDVLNSVAVFAETGIRSESDDFKGGKLTTVFGGVKVDLRHVEVSEQGAVSEITSVFGGVEFYVPENVRVEFGGTPIFGGFEDKTRRRVKDGTEKVIYVQGTFVFSGVEVRD